MSQADSISTIRAAQHAANQLHAGEHELRDRHAALVKEHQWVKYGLASQPECLANIDRLVDERRDNFDDLRGDLVIRAVSGYLQSRHDSTGRARDQRIPPHLPQVGDQLNGGGLTFDDLCWLAPDIVKAALARVVSSGKRFGLPPKERAERLATLETEIAAVEREHAALVSAAAEVGISLPALPKQG